MKLKTVNIFVFILLSFFYGCNSIDTDSQIPYVSVNFETNLNTIEMQALNTLGWVYVENQGVKGLIIRKNGSIYNVFDRTCTFQPRNSCSKLSVELTNSRMLCPCEDCKSIFDWSGKPNGGAASLPLVQYNAQVINGRTLKITN